MSDDKPPPSPEPTESEIVRFADSMVASREQSSTVTQNSPSTQENLGTVADSQLQGNEILPPSDTQTFTEPVRHVQTFFPQKCDFAVYAYTA